MAKKGETKGESTAVAEPEEVGTDVVPAGNGLVTTNFDVDFSEDSEAQDESEVKIPFLKVLQKESKEVEDQQPKGCKAGDLYNSATGEFFDGKEGVHLLTVHRHHGFVEWKPIKEGGGKQGVHELNSELVNRCKESQDFGKYKNPDDVEMVLALAQKEGKVPNLEACNDITETFTVWAVMVKPDGSLERVVLSLTSTKIKAWRDWIRRALNTKVNNKKPFFFQHQIRFSTWTDNNDFGDFTNVKIVPLINDNYIDSLAGNSPELDEAYAFRIDLKNGMYGVDSLNHEQTEGATSGGDFDSVGGDADADGTVPF